MITLATLISGLAQPTILPSPMQREREGFISTTTCVGQVGCRTNKHGFAVLAGPVLQGVVLGVAIVRIVIVRRRRNDVADRVKLILR